ncbi:uncharacterized protein LOC107418595 [Ziziphus jujuba]|uniref:O-glucosyltransferase rumi homolog n=1 Tax=Ziziphus jujuba TaxID=326968 RepID=A0A6P6G6P1_ZIZJJ|nr:uncharacterized protein LOC107418595 [Ziziphus jujuba]XP_024929825.1 uncharacterized protein LOC107418595 [Ziziphus jujuba]
MRNCTQRFVLQPLIKYPTFFFLLLLLVGSFVSIYFLNIPILNRSNSGQVIITKTTSDKCPQENKVHKTYKEIPLNCTGYANTQTCPSNNKPAYISEQDPNCSSELSTCPEYFQWIYEDLRPWFRTGITSEMVDKAKAKSHFKLVILNGKAYVEKYGKAFQTRDLFTWWGFAQLLRRYPGQVPDLELVFSCHDWPAFLARDYPKANATDTGILFGYCGDDDTVDIAFPDWSYWGWPEVNIKPWEYMVKDIGQGNKNMKWVDREPFAFWKGNPGYAQARKDLMKCNRTEKEDWNARLYTQDWGKESKEGFKNSDLASQCTHRYKIYVEGNAWSVSQKYILACDSLTLLINSSYYDFFSRGLKPLQHYWPIKANDKCRSIKHAVDWGNTHQKEAQAIGKAATKFIKEELKMDHVYDYMFHLLNVYAKLLKFKPSIPQKAFELCLESMFCQANELEKRYMMDSMVRGPADTNPCTMPPPFGPSFYEILDKTADSFKKVDLLEKRYWENQNKSR